MAVIKSVLRHPHLMPERASLLQTCTEKYLLGDGDAFDFWHGVGTVPVVTRMAMSFL